MGIFKKITALVIFLVIMTYALIGYISTSSAFTMKRAIKVGVLLSNVNNPYLSSIQKDLEAIQRENIDKNNDGILQYIMLQASNNLPIAVTRTKSAISKINDAGIRTEELALVNANFNKELAKDAIKSLFLKYNGKIEAIISNNDSMAIGAINALQTYGYNQGDKSKNIVVVGIDKTQEAKDLIDKGFMTGTIGHEPRALANALYTVGINLISDRDPIEGTNYKIEDNGIEIRIPSEEYKKSL